MPSTSSKGSGPAPFPDPRPSVSTVDGRSVIEGRRCTSCNFPSALPVPWCPRCRADVSLERFGPDGVVWSSTVVHVPLPGRTPPYTLAYVDLSEGPRILAHVRDSNAVVSPGARVRLVGLSPDGDPQVVLA